MSTVASHPAYASSEETALLPSPAPIGETLRQHSAQADQRLQEIWRATGLETVDALALVATGGYGRRALFLHSDIDILILRRPTNTAAGDSHAQAFAESLSAFVSRCWDEGLTIALSVLNTDECVAQARQDLSTETALLDIRQLCGPRSLYNELSARLLQIRDPQRFFHAKLAELHQRHLAHQKTPYALEPDCKESPGALRDLHTVRWIAQAAGYNTNDWHSLCQSGLLTAHEAQALERSEAALSQIRQCLHRLAGRREDRLLFELQPALASACGFSEANAQLSTQAFMRHYYWTAKAVTQLTEIALLNLEQQLFPDKREPHMLRPEQPHEPFVLHQDRITLKDPHLFEHRPVAIMEAFLAFAAQPQARGFCVQTLRALYKSRHLMDATWRAHPHNRRLFMHILRQPRGVTRTLRLMNQTSVLGRYLWVFRQTVGQLQHDLFHAYTVDQHILMVVRNIRRFFIAEHAHEYPLCSQIASRWDKPELLYIAALFHDIAKGRQGDHSLLGAQDVRLFAEEHGLDSADSELLVFLVREHLTMSRVAQKEDFSDPQILGRFAALVGSPRYLDGLYLLTVADIRGTSPKIWNAWKGKLLQDLYQTTSHRLADASTQGTDLHNLLDERQQQALSLLALHALPAEAHKSLWAALDMRYFMRQSAEEIAWHTRHISRARATALSCGDTPRHPAAPPVVRARATDVEKSIQIFVWAPDGKDLFARLCGFFYEHRLEVLEARIHTTVDGYALDTFVLGAQHLDHVGQEQLALLEHLLGTHLQSDSALRPVAKHHLSRRAKNFPVTPRVHLEPDEHQSHWIVTLQCNDQPGLLYSAALVMARYTVDVQMARITTLGEHIEDTLLIASPQLAQGKTRIQFELDLLAAIS